MKYRIGSGIDNRVSSKQSWRRPHLSVFGRIGAALLAAGIIGVFALAPVFAEGDFSDTGGRPFATNSAWNSPIGSDVQLDPNSSAMVSALRSRTPVANLYKYGTPVFSADASTPRYSVNCTMSWGVCNLEKEKIPIPSGAQGAPGSDGQMVIVDWSTRKAYEFWQYKGDRANTSWGDVVSLDGEGNGSTAVGAGTSRLSGLVRSFEIAQGKIDHALTFSTSYCQKDTFRYPATKTDGKYSGANALPEGARVQLDPSINVDALPNMTPGEKIVAKALQAYGAYNIDCGGATMAFQFENPIGKADPYRSAGFTYDYFGMSHIPWDKLRVLKAWDSYTPVGDPEDPPTEPPTKVGDINGDDLVDFKDMDILVNHFGQTYEAADLDHDGIVGEPDYVIVRDNWSE